MDKKLFLFTLFLLLFSILLFASGGKEQSEEIISGNLKLVVYKRNGSFCLYRRSPIGKDKYLPLYDDRAMSGTNYYKVLFNGKQYKLDKKLGKDVSVNKEKDSILMKFEFNENFYIEQRLSFTNQEYNTSGKLLEIITTVENTSGGFASVALKAIFDTVIGENRRVSLYTDSHSSIFSETRIDGKATNDHYIASADSKSACLIFINHEKQTRPNEIYIANWEYLQTSKWAPNYIAGRSFSTKYYNNDSAVLLLWPEKNLGLNEKYTVTNLVGFNDFLKMDLPKEVIDKHLKTMTDKERKNYDKIKALLEKIEDVRGNPDKYTDEELLVLTEEVDKAMKELDK